MSPLSDTIEETEAVVRWPLLAALAQVADRRKALPQAIRQAGADLPNPHLDVIEAALRVLDSTTMSDGALADDAKLVRDRLSRDLVDKGQADALYDVGAEVVTAAWLAERGRLAETPCPTDRGDPVIDLGLVVGGVVNGVEVKRNHNDPETVILDTPIKEDTKSGIDDKRPARSLRKRLREYFGPHVTLAVKWCGGQIPPMADLEKSLPKVFVQLRDALQEARPGDPPVEVPLPRPSEDEQPETSSCINYGARFRGLTILASFGPMVTTHWNDVGEGWGVVVERIKKDATKKADNLAAINLDLDFILAYTSFPDRSGWMDAHRLASTCRYCFGCSCLSLPPRFRGLVILDVTMPDGILRWDAVGAFRSGGSASGAAQEHLALRPLPNVVPKGETAAAVWQRLIDEWAKVDLARIPESSREEWGELGQRILAAMPSSSNANDLWAKACILSSRVGQKVGSLQVYSGIANSPFPCPADRLVFPRRFRVPRP